VMDMPSLKRFIAGLSTVAGLKLVTISHGDPIATNPAAELRAIGA